MFPILPSIDAAADALRGWRFVSAEFMYRPRPTGERERIVFDSTLSARLAALSSDDAALFICDSAATAESLAFWRERYPQVTMAAIITNPAPFVGVTGNTPALLGWAGEWERYAMTDRWARITVALEVARWLNHPGFLLMPAHDAVYTRELLDILVHTASVHSKRGIPAAVSPYTYWQHSPVIGADIPADIISLLNTIFGRDLLFPWKIQTDRVQAFWGKMSLMPFAMCGEVLKHAENTIWEDDLEIDRVIRDLGYGVRAVWINRPSLYRQALPVFDLDGVRRVVERTLHYSLNVSGEASALSFPLGRLARIRRALDPRFARDNARAEALIAECRAEIDARLRQFGASWVDWGRYRYVIRVGDPVVEVWKNLTP